MKIEHRGKRPDIHPTAVIAPGAIISGDVTIGEDSAVLHGAVITSQGGPVNIGSNCVIMEHAVVRGSKRYPATIGNNCLLGPNGYVTGATVGDSVFMATGCAIFNGATLGARSQVRIHGVVHINSVLPEDARVPIGWVAVGNPAEIHPPGDHDAIWAVQKTLDFPGTVFGLPRAQPGETYMPEAMRRYTRALQAHQEDEIIED
jgi:carbonic anhydrase/acetyltransferase-like protein (isoleucine patch superfamily)